MTHGKHIIKSWKNIIFCAKCGKRIKNLVKSDQLCTDCLMKKGDNNNK